MTKQTAAAALANEPARHEMIHLSNLRESPLNHRRTFDEVKLKELAESIKKHGVIQPVIARPIATGFELVVGHRRSRAASLAGLDKIPAIVRQMDDRSVLELQLIENVQREDVHPLEEADGYHLLIERHGYDVDSLAAKLGKSKAHVYGRLKLAQMLPTAKDAFLKGKFSAGVAMVIARVPEHHQAEALKLVLNPPWRPDASESISAREALNLIRNRLMLQLKSAPFSLVDATLVPEAGACKTCPKRTGCQPQLFNDVDEADTCTDPTCFAKKKDASWAREKEKAAADGVQVLEGKDAKGTKGAGSKYIALEDRHGRFEEGRGYVETPWKSILGKSAGKPVAIARDENGEVRHLVEKAHAAEVLKKTKPDLARQLKQAVAGEDPKEAEQRKKEKEREQRRWETENALHAAAVEKAVAHVVASGLSKDILQHLVEQVVSQGWADEAATRRLGDGVDEQELVDRLPKMSAGELQGLLFEILLGSSYDTSVQDLSRLGRFDLKKLEKQVKEDLAKKAKAESDEKPEKKTAGRSKS